VPPRLPILEPGSAVGFFLDTLCSPAPALCSLQAAMGITTSGSHQGMAGSWLPHCCERFGRAMLSWWQVGAAAVAATALSSVVRASCGLTSYNAFSPPTIRCGVRVCRQAAVAVLPGVH
jgi:hypothetical protein